MSSHTPRTAARRRPSRPHGRYVLVGQKDFYDFSNPVDCAEFATVVGYGRR